MATPNSTILPSNATILSVIILKHIKLENNQSHIEIIVDSETNGLKALSLNEKYSKLFKSIHNQKNAYRLDTDIGDILTIDIIKNLRNKQWQLMTSHSFTHFAVQKVIESNFYFERISTSPLISSNSNNSEENSELISYVSASKDDPITNTPQVVLANAALHPSPTHAPSTEQKLPEEKLKPSNSTGGSPIASSSSTRPENTNSTSQHISQTGIKLEPKIDPQQITFVKPIVDIDKPKPVADPEVMAFILDKTGQTKGPYSFASRPTVAGQLSKSRKEVAVEDSVESANANALQAIERSSTIERKPSELNKVVAESGTIPVRPSDYNTENKPRSRNPSPVVRPSSTTSSTSAAAKSVLTSTKTPTTSSYDLKALTKTVPESEEELTSSKPATAGSSTTEKVNELSKKNSRLDFVVTETNNKSLNSSSSSNNLKSGLPPKASSNNLLAKKEVEAIAALSPPPEVTTISSLSSEVVRERRPSLSEKNEEIPAVRRNSKDFSTATVAPASMTVKSAPAAANLQPINTTNNPATQSKTEPQVKIEEPKSNTKSIAMKLFGGGNNSDDNNSVTSNTSQDKGMKEKTASSGNLKGEESSNDGTPKAAPYRRASESINKLFNKYQPKKKSIFGKEEEEKAPSTSTTPSNRKMSLTQLLQKDAGLSPPPEESKEQISSDPTASTASKKLFAAPTSAVNNTVKTSPPSSSTATVSTTKDPVMENLPPEPVPMPFKAKSADEATISKSASVGIEVSIPQITTHESTSSLLSDLDQTPPSSAGGKIEAESPITPSKTQFLENLKRISQTGASGPPPPSERPLSSALGRKQLSMSSIDFDMNTGDDDEFAFSGKPGLALKKKEEPIDEEHESSKTQHYSRLGSAFVSGNVLTRGRGAGRGGAAGRGRGL